LGAYICYQSKGIVKQKNYQGNIVWTHNSHNGCLFDCYIIRSDMIQEVFF
jgi:hypothetical protein